jgi:tryptophan synthase alpha chain
MTAIERTFAQLRARGAGGFIPYITAGDPDLATTYELLLALHRADASVIELGFPFSDPIADGPVIQRACSRALQRGVTLPDVLAVTREASRRMDCPIVLFSYMNPILQYGFERLLETAPADGIAGLLLTDLPGDAAPRLSALAQQHGVDLIVLAAPTCTDERLRTICTNARGFLYAVSRTGVTGLREHLGEEVRETVQRIRRFSSLPVAVGFGISNPGQAAEVLAFADAAVVGSAIVQSIEENAGRPGLIQCVENLARGFSEVQLPKPDKAGAGKS